MPLAELEVFHSRPIAPTRRVALGDSDLPVSPAPGFGGILLGGVVAAFMPALDPDLFDDLDRLTLQLEAGMRIPQPRLRFRMQVDRIGLQRSVHRWPVCASPSRASASACRSTASACSAACTASTATARR